MQYYLDQGDLYVLELPEYDNLADIEPVDDADRGAGHVEVADERDAGEDAP